MHEASKGKWRIKHSIFLHGIAPSVRTMIYRRDKAMTEITQPLHGVPQFKNEHIIPPKIRDWARDSHLRFYEKHSAKKKYHEEKH